MNGPDEEVPEDEDGYFWGDNSSGLSGDLDSIYRPIEDDEEG